MVCVDDRPSHDGVPSGLIKGEVYTIDGFEECFWEPHLGVHLAERPLSQDEKRRYCGYHPNRFRPIVERKTDISIFTKMLNTKKKKVDA